MSLDIESLSDDKPLLLIDVDGVLNCICRNPHARMYDVFSFGPYRIAIRHETGRWLKRLSESFHPVWCTMWDEQANLVLAPRLGLPELPVIPCDERRYDAPMEWEGLSLHSKIPCIVEHVGDRAFAWVDDEIGSHDTAWSRQRDDEEAPTYLLKIDPRMGLLEHHVNKLVGWAERIK